MRYDGDIDIVRIQLLPWKTYLLVRIICSSSAIIIQQQDTLERELLK